MKKKEQRLWTVIACVAAVLLVLMILPFARKSEGDVAEIVVGMSDSPGSVRGGKIGSARNGGDSPNGSPDGTRGVDGDPNATQIGFKKPEPKSGDGTTSGTLSGSGPGGAPGANGSLGGPGGSSGSDGSSGKGGLGKGGKGTDGTGTGADGDDNSDGEEGIATVGGHVKRGETAVVRARISLTGESDGSIRFADSADDGAYIFEGVPTGSYTVTLMSPQSSSPRRAVNLAKDDQKLGEDFNLPPAEGLIGDVVSSAGGEGVPKPRLTILAGTRLVGTIDGDEFGAFELMPLDAGSYLAKIQASDYRPGEFTFNVEGNPSQSPLRFELEPSQQIAGTVYMQNGQGAGGATVALFGLQGSAFADPYAAAGTFLCDGEGNFTFSSLPAGLSGPFRVGALRKEAVPAYGATLDPEHDRTYENPVEVRLSDGVSVSGTIVDKDNKGIPGAQVQVIEGFPTTSAIFQRLSRPFPSATADNAGKFLLTAIENAPIKIRISATGYTSEDKDVTTVAPTLDIGTVKLKGLDDGEAGRLAGVILTETGDPVVGADVYAKCLDCEGGGSVMFMRSDSTGAFAFDEMPDGTYSIVVAGSILRHGVFIPLGQTMAGLRPGQPAGVIIFDHSQSIRLRVLDSDGNFPGRLRVGVAVTSELPGGAMGVQNKWEMRYDTELQLTGGEAIVGDLLYGVGSLTISIPGGGSKEISGININVGGQTDLGDVRVGESGSISGRAVAAESGSGLSGVLVKALPPQGAPPTHPLNALNYSTITTGNGDFTLDGLPALSAADFSFEMSGRVTAYARNISIPAGSTGSTGSVTLEQAGTLRGTVAGPNGAGANDILVRIDSIIVFTDAQGNYSAANVPPGIANVSFQDRSGVLGTIDDTVEIQGGQVTVYNVTMLPKGSGG
jgi:hypothetical protein